VCVCVCVRVCVRKQTRKVHHDLKNEVPTVVVEAIDTVVAQTAVNGLR
jgi:hypothetical protein